MKNTKIALVAVLSSLSINVMAQSKSLEGFDGILSAAVGSTKLSAEGSSDTDRLINLRGSFSFTDKTGFGVQIDNAYDKQNSLYGEKVQSDDLALHAFYRNQQYLVGLIHQTRKYKSSGGFGPGEFVIPMDRTFTGLEAQYHLKDVTLYGQFTRDKLNIFGFEEKGNTNMVEARYFFSDNLRTDLGYTKSDFNTSKVNTVTAGVEYRLDNSPVSIFAKYQNSNGKSDAVDTTRYTVGVTYNFGKTSLRERNSSGVSLNPVKIDNIPQIVEFFGIP